MLIPLDKCVLNIISPWCKHLELHFNGSWGESSSSSSFFPSRLKITSTFRNSEGKLHTQTILDTMTEKKAVNTQQRLISSQPLYSMGKACLFTCWHFRFFLSGIAALWTIKSQWALGTDTWFAEKTWKLHTRGWSLQHQGCSHTERTPPEQQEPRESIFKWKWMPLATPYRSF